MLEPSKASDHCSCRSGGMGGWAGLAYLYIYPSIGFVGAAHCPETCQVRCCTCSCRSLAGGVAARATRVTRLAEGGFKLSDRRQACPLLNSFGRSMAC
jgi:hypothetical protein